MMNLDDMVFGTHGTFNCAALNFPKIGDVVAVCDGKYFGTVTFAGFFTASVELVRVKGNLVELIYDENGHLLRAQWEEGHEEDHEEGHEEDHEEGHEEDHEEESEEDHEEESEEDHEEESEDFINQF